MIEPIRQGVARNVGVFFPASLTSSRTIRSADHSRLWPAALFDDTAPFLRSNLGNRCSQTPIRFGSRSRQLTMVDSVRWKPVRSGVLNYSSLIAASRNRFVTSRQLAIPALCLYRRPRTHRGELLRGDLCIMGWQTPPELGRLSLESGEHRLRNAASSNHLRVECSFNPSTAFGFRSGIFPGQISAPARSTEPPPHAVAAGLPIDQRTDSIIPYTRRSSWPGAIARQTAGIRSGRESCFRQRSDFGRGGAAKGAC